tara:strand:+ start:29859 stop:30854 length:996 start_codon:yes stop_codon:yes gene_type:complete
MENFKLNDNIEHVCQWIHDRDMVFRKKSSGEPFPWTDNEVISTHKFTNVFRVLDWESQFLIRNVIGNDDRNVIDTTFRILLFKHINYQPTWEYLEDRLGEITFREGIIDDIKESLDEYCIDNKVYSSAYLQAANFVRNEPWKHLRGTGKHNAYLTVFEAQLFNEKSLNEFISNRDKPSLRNLINKLQEIDGVGNFMAYQFAQDLNYSKFWNQDLNYETFEGPGSMRGIDRCFSGHSKRDYAKLIKWTWENIDLLFEQFGLGEPPKFKGMPIQLTDMQNCFCESDKYMRGLGIVSEGVSGKTIKQKYKPNNMRKLEAILPIKFRNKVWSTNS